MLLCVIGRREFVACTALAASAAQTAPMFGLIGKMTAVDGRREELLQILLAEIKDMPGCLSYVIAADPADRNSLWITEVWIDKAAHDASLSLPAVKKAIASARPLIAAFSSPAETVPLGGIGLVSPK